MGQSSGKIIKEKNERLSLKKMDVKYLSVGLIKEELNNKLPDDDNERHILLFTLFTIIIYLLETMVDELLRTKKKLTSTKVKRKINELLDLIRILFTEMEFNPNYRIVNSKSDHITRPQNNTIEDVKYKYFNQFLYKNYNYTPFEIFIKNMGLDLEWHCKYDPIEPVLDISLQIVEIFMNSGADINSSNQNEHTFSNPLYLALDNDNYKVVNVFLENTLLDVNIGVLGSPVIAALFYEEFEFEFNKIKNIKEFDFTKENSRGLTMLEDLIFLYYNISYPLRKFNRNKKNIKQLISYYKDYPHIIEKCLLQISKIEKEELKNFETKEQSKYSNNKFETFELYYQNTSIFPIFKTLLQQYTFLDQLTFKTLGGDKLVHTDVDYIKQYELYELKKILSKSNKTISDPNTFNIIDIITGVEIPDDQLFNLKPQTYVIGFK